MRKTLFIIGIAIAACSTLPALMAKAIAGNFISLPAKVKVIDLTQPINTKAPDYFGKGDEFKYQSLSSVAKDGYASGEFSTHEHLGTHMDAPIHFYENGKTIAELNPNNLVLPIVVMDIRKEVKNNPDYLLSVEKIKSVEKHTKINPGAAILLLTGWDKRYFVNGQYRNADKKGVMHFPGFSKEAAQYLVDQCHAQALGTDTLSADCGSTEEFPVHKVVLGKGLFMIEDLCNLDQLPSTGAIGIFAPLKLEDGTGCPARVLALIPQ